MGYKEMEQRSMNHKTLMQAAAWTLVEDIIKRQTLTCLRHVARVPPERTPKQALFGWVTGPEQDDRGDKSQVTWIEGVLKEARMPEMDWFRLAQNKGKSGLWM